MTRPWLAMYTPSPRGGHAAYTQELMRAIAAIPGTGRIGVVTSETIDPEFRAGPYEVWPVLPARGDGARSSVAWAWGRLTHYVRRERRFVRWVTAERPAIVHLQELSPLVGRWTVRRLRRTGAVVVMTVHNVVGHRRRGRRVDAVVARRERAMWRSCDALIVHGDGLRTALERRLGPSTTRVAVIPHGVWQRPETTPWRGFGSPPHRLLSFGTLRPNKGLPALVQALDELPDWTLTIAGQAVDPAHLTRDLEPSVAAVNRRRPGAVDLRPGFVPDGELDALLADHDALALTYREFAAQSGVLFQAVASGRPVVVTDVGELGETVRRHGLGVVAEGGAPSDLAAAVRRLLDLDPGALADARARLDGEQSWAAVAARHVACYRELVGVAGAGTAG